MGAMLDRNLRARPAVYVDLGRDLYHHRAHVSGATDIRREGTRAHRGSGRHLRRGDRISQLHDRGYGSFADAAGEVLQTSRTRNSRFN